MAGNGLALFRREVDAFIIPIAQDVLQVGGEAKAHGVCNLDVCILLEEDGLAGEALMRNAVLFKRGQGRNAAAQQTPHLFHLIWPILERADGDVIEQ